MAKEKSVIRKNTVYELDVKLRYHPCSRVIKMPENATLEDLHNMIQNAFDFDNDHLYEFYIGKGADKKVYASPMDMYNDSELWADKTKLKEIGLKKKFKFEYLFDFGDEWWFDIAVKNILDEDIRKPQITDYYGEAPEQYPDYDYEESVFEVEISEKLTVKEILDEIEDENINANYEVLFKERDDSLMFASDTQKKREEIAELVLNNPELLLQFFENNVRNIVVELVTEGGEVAHDEFCNLMKLYAFGFCKVEESEEDWDDELTVIVPIEIKQAYEKEIKKLKKSMPIDKIIMLSCTYLKICGVIEMDKLYEIITPMVKKKYAYHEFKWLVFSHLVFWDRYEIWEIENAEYLSLYDDIITKEIVDERKKYTKEEYPVFDKKELSEYEEYKGAKLEWYQYINFSLLIDDRNAQELSVEIPYLIASGVVSEERMLVYYAERIKKAGNRKTKKAERIIHKMYEELTVATHKGNLKMPDTEQEEYIQLSLFDDM